MGTNYYFEQEKCPCCGHAKQRLHLGKMSAGWVFALQVLPEEGLNCLEDWEARIKASLDPIIDEYGREVNWMDLKRDIQQREWHTEWDSEFRELPRGYKSEADLHRRNYSERVPKGLLRSKVDGTHCVGHDGMVDLITGDFS